MTKQQEINRNRELFQEEIKPLLEDFRIKMESLLGRREKEYGLSIKFPGTGDYKGLYSSYNFIVTEKKLVCGGPDRAWPVAYRDLPERFAMTYLVEALNEALIYVTQYTKPMTVFKPDNNQEQYLIYDDFDDDDD